MKRNIKCQKRSAFFSHHSLLLITVLHWRGTGRFNITRAFPVKCHRIRIVIFAAKSATRVACRRFIFSVFCFHSKRYGRKVSFSYCSSSRLVLWLAHVSLQFYARKRPAQEEFSTATASSTKRPRVDRNVSIFFPRYSSYNQRNQKSQARFLSLSA